MPDTVRLPAAWSKYLLPIRGRRPGLEIELDTAAAAEAARQTAEHRSAIETALSLPHNQHYAAVGLDHLNGNPNPAGAAVVECLLRGDGFREEYPRNLDAWVVERGLGFTAAAMVESMAIELRTSGRRPSRLVEIDTSLMGVLWPHCVFKAIARTRALLARASDDDYAAAVAAVRPHRSSQVRRIAAALLMPTESDWVGQACAEPVWNEYNNWVRWSIADTPERAAASGPDHIPADAVLVQSLAPLLDGLGLDSLPVLAATTTQPQQLGAREYALVLDAIGRLPDADAAGFLIDHLTVIGALKALPAMAEQFPAHVLRAVAERAPTADPALRVKLAGIAKIASGSKETARASLDAGERQAVAELIDGAAPVPVAPAEALPPFFAPPTADREAVVIQGLRAPDGTTIVWAEGELERWSVPEKEDLGRTGHDWMDSFERSSSRYRGHCLTRALVRDPKSIVAEPLLTWNESLEPDSADDLYTILARHGADAARILLLTLRKRPRHHRVLPSILNLEAARVAADWLTRAKPERASAIVWIDRHGADGARLLIPDALGEDQRLRPAAEGALRFAAARHGSEAVLAAAEPYGEEAVAATKDLLEGDPLRGVKPPVGAWADPAMLPQVLLKGREAALPEEAVRRLVTVLAIATPESPHPGIDIVAEACDPASLSRFSWALFEQWLSAGAVPKDHWAFAQLGHFGDDAAVRELTPMIRRWPGENQHRRAVTGLEVLGAIGSEEALRAVHGIAEKVKFKALKARAREQIDAIAAGLELSADQLADRLVPDFGLGEDDTLLLDYGPRRFRVGLDEQLKPFVTDEDGKRRKSLPKPGVKDDAELAEPAYKRFARLRKDLRTVAKEQMRRLERAMVEGRTWTVPEFKEFFAEHPLVWHLARRLIWLADFDGRRLGFRIAEDRTFTGVDDNELDLPGHAVIRLAHPIHIDRDEAEAWGGIFADYEILQPFEQLARPVMALTEEELKTGWFSRFDGASMKLGSLLGLTEGDWHRADPRDAGIVPGFYRPLPGGGYVLISIEPGEGINLSDPASDEPIRGVYLSDSEDYGHFDVNRPDHRHSVEIDPVTASEVLLTLTRIAEAD